MKDGPYTLEAGTCLSIQVQFLAGCNRDAEALAVCHEAVNLYKALESKGELPANHYNYYIQNMLEIGYAHLCQGRLQESERHYLDVLKQRKLSLFSNLKLILLQGLTRIYERKQDWPNCRKYAQEELDLLKDVPKDEVSRPCIEPFF